MSCHQRGQETEEQEAARPPSADVVAALVDNYREFLGFLENRVGDRALAEDILQEAFVRRIERANTLQNQESVTAWFYRTLRNSVVDHYRRAGARAVVAEASAADPDSASTAGSASGRAAAVGRAAAPRNRP